VVWLLAFSVVVYQTAECYFNKTSPCYVKALCAQMTTVNPQTCREEYLVSSTLLALEAARLTQVMDLTVADVHSPSVFFRAASLGCSEDKSWSIMNEQGQLFECTGTNCATVSCPLGQSVALPQGEYTTVLSEGLLTACHGEFPWSGTAVLSASRLSAVVSTCGSIPCLRALVADTSGHLIVYEIGSSAVPLGRLLLPAGSSEFNFIDVHTDGTLGLGLSDTRHIAAWNVSTGVFLGIWRAAGVDGSLTGICSAGGKIFVSGQDASFSFVASGRIF